MRTLCYGRNTVKTFEEVNEKIRAGNVVVVTAEELIGRVAERGVSKTAQEVDVVTTATFGPMCSSGAFLNFGHSEPPIRMGHITLNDVEAYGGLAAVDTYIGATQPSETQGIEYGGAHVIEDLIAGKTIKLHATSPGTDCYPRKEIETEISLDTINQAYMYSPRNVYQNYPAATNSSKRVIQTYMGTLLPNHGNITYTTSGELSPLLKDPQLRTIGQGTRIFFGGGVGYVAWEGSQFVLNHAELDNGDTWNAGATLALIGDLRGMSTKYIRGATYSGYGTTMLVGMGIPIPVLDEELCAQLAATNAHLHTYIQDYSQPTRNREKLQRVSYAELRSGSVQFNGHSVTTAPLSSLKIAREIADILKQWIAQGTFELQEPIASLPKDRVFKPLNIK